MDKSDHASQICNELELETKSTQPLHRMLCGPLECSLLKSLIQLNSSKRVLELGTFTGYSALSMAEALPVDGEVVTIDKNKKINETAKKFWSRSIHGSKIKALFGDAIDVLKTLEGTFDLVFIDADKRNYKNYFELCIDLLSENGVIIVDNVLWSGRVIEGLSTDEDKSTVYLKEFNDYIYSREDLVKTLLPVRDGIFLIQKRK